jgi:anti-anti-sigma factor
MNLQERNEEDTLVVEIEGEADLSTVPQFQALMREKMKEGHPRLIIDFSKVTFVNTPVWAVVVEYYQHSHKAKSEFALAGLQDRVEASFNIVRLGEFIPHFPTVEEALAGGESAAS